MVNIFVIALIVTAKIVSNIYLPNIFLEIFNFFLNYADFYF